jgi:hypothetical protein
MNNKIIDPGFNILNNTFPDKTNIDKTKLKMTTEGLYSVSGKDGARFITKIILKNMKKNYNITITDCTANNGSETLMFAKYFYKVNSIEIDDINYEVLKNNINIYKYKNINLIKGNSIIELEKLKQDVIVIDAPWGGPNYKNEKQLKLFLDNLELSDIFNQFKNKAKLFVLKVPINYNINNLILNSLLYKIKIYSYKQNSRIKFFIIVIHNMKKI